MKYAAGLLLPFTFFTSKIYAQKGEVAVVGDTTYAIPKLKKMPGSISSPQSCESNNTRIIIGGAVSTLSMKKAMKDVVFITGRVLDADDGTPIASASITLDDGKLTVITNADGYFVIQKSKQQKQAAITISSVGYQKAELDVSNKKIKSNIVDLSAIHLSRQVLGISEVIITGYQGRRMGGLTMGVLIIKNSVADTIKNFITPNKIKVFPNPVPLGGTIQLNFGNVKQGNYQIRLLNSSGQLFYSFQKQISSANETEQIHLHERMSAGVYLLQIIDDKKRLVQTNKVIIQ